MPWKLRGRLRADGLKRISRQVRSMRISCGHKEQEEKGQRWRKKWAGGIALVPGPCTRKSITAEDLELVGRIARRWILSYPWPASQPKEG